MINILFFLKPFNDNRKRWHRWIFGTQQLEIGCDGDVNQESIIRTDLMGGKTAVEKTQKFLAENERGLIGSLVTLEKTQIPGEPNPKFHYRINLEFGGEVWCLGYLREYVTRDLLGVGKQGKWLPGKIHNLRIGAVTTCVGKAAPHHEVPSPWRESRFWLSVCVHGIGQFKI